MTSHEALGRIDGLEKFGINLGLERISACLNDLGNPQDALRTVHVGGTNGKGSTCAFLASSLRAAGHKVGLYTSPPLESFGERIQVDGKPLALEELPQLLEAVEATRAGARETGAMTQFEVITALAFLHFARARVDVAVIEVGLGGRLDSTNVIDPELSVVTNVGMEHAEHLGPTLADIAREKGGIIKPGRPLVTAAVGESADVLAGIARECAAPLRRLGREFAAERAADGRLRYRGPRWRLADLKLGLRGGFQAANAGVALAALECLEEADWKISEAAVRDGLANARWPGRLELLGDGPRVLLDGAHNPHASQQLAAALRSPEFPRERLWLVLGILGDKDARSILGDLLPLADVVVLTRSTSARASDPRELAAKVDKACRAEVRVVEPLSLAMTQTVAQAGVGDLICVTGSLTTVGEARGWLRREGWVR